MVQVHGLCSSTHFVVVQSSPCQDIKIEFKKFFSPTVIPQLITQSPLVNTQYIFIYMHHKLYVFIDILCLLLFLVPCKKCAWILSCLIDSSLVENGNSMT